MTECVTSKLPKWPFFLGDLLLLGFAGFIVYENPGRLGLWQMGFCLAAIVFGAGFSIIPFLREYRGGVHLAEAHTLADAMAEFQNVKDIQDRIDRATAQWLTVQEQSASTVNAAKSIAERMTAETREFMVFLDKANDTEKAHLRLEVEKLRRAEGEWLQVTVRILDHIFALNQAAGRSGQPALITQLGHFQHACRDAVRRVGLSPFTAGPGDPFDGKAHQTADPQEKLAADARIGETLATGYSYQGQLLRKAVVRIGPEPQPELPLLDLTAEESPSPNQAQPPAARNSDPNIQSESVVTLA